MAKTKTDNVSIRFDLKQLDFIKEREGIDSPQRVVNFLMNKYWFENRIHQGEKTATGFVNNSPLIAKELHYTQRFDGKKETTVSEIENNTIINEQAKTPVKFTLKRSPEQWVELRRSCETYEDYQQWLSNLEADPYLTTVQKKLIRATS